jgi:hypothetical protein
MVTYKNAHQTFCAQAEMIEFPDGKGIRYLANYIQDINPILDNQIFYTFQGLTDDGQFYIAAFFPVETGIFPTEYPPCPQCSEASYNPYPDWFSTLSAQLLQLNDLSTHRFGPTLTELDDVVQSIYLVEP